MISNQDYAEEAANLLETAEQTEIPYVAGGMTLNGMDCQGLCEYLLIQCGIAKAECDLAGSNAHYRNCSWTGTPEEAVEKFGRVPDGAWVFILADDGGEPAKYKPDGIGNASHMGVKVCDGTALHASSSRGKVCSSVFRDKTIANGGWNRVGLPPWVDFGDEQEEQEEQDDVYDSIEEARKALVPQKESYKKYALVTSPNEFDVKLREKPDKKAIYKYKVPAGEFLPYQGETGDYYKVLYNGSTRYLLKDFGQVVKVKA